MVESGKKFNVVAISGSTRAASTNSALLKLAQELGKDKLNIEILDIKGVPLYDGDIEAAGIPEQVKTIAPRLLLLMASTLLPQSTTTPFLLLSRTSLTGSPASSPTLSPKSLLPSQQLLQALPVVPVLSTT